jgi:hypothetical protein
MHGNSFRNVQTLCMKYLKKTPQEGESKLWVVFFCSWVYYGG